MAADCLTDDEREVLRVVYRRDVKYWENWGACVKVAKREGVCPMGLSWVILRFKPCPELPILRVQMNDIYLGALQEYAEQYQLSVCVDPGCNKVILYDPQKAPAEWLENVTVPGVSSRC